MKEICAVPWNGYYVISTFAGAGGSSLGYRMAGFKIAYANEFVPAALGVYAANAAEETIFDGADIRTRDPLEVLRCTEIEPGELDVLDGSPPCASFSTAGKREKHWGQEKRYSDVKQRTDDLFFEYVRFVKAIQPKVFVAENVSGLVKGVAKGYFIEILAALKKCGYRVEARLLDAQWLGVPQQRQRIIFIGVRKDLDLEPVFPKPLSYRYSVRDALPEIIQAAKVRWILNDTHFQVVEVEPETDISKMAIGREYDLLNPGQVSDRYFNLVRADLGAPCQTVTASGGASSSIASVTHPTEKRKFAIAELKRICGFPDDFVLLGTYAQQWERLGRAVPPPMMFRIASSVVEILDRCRSRRSPTAKTKSRAGRRSRSGTAHSGSE